MTYFSNFETGMGKVQTSNFARGLKVRGWINPDTKQKCKTGHNESWSRSHATFSSPDLLNKQATEALRNGKI